MLEFLDGVTEFDYYDVIEKVGYETLGLGTIEALYGMEGKKVPYILCDEKNNRVQFQFQSGPIKESGVNGCQIDFAILFVRYLLITANDKYPDQNNERAINHLGQALSALEDRRKERTSRGVEGTNQQ